MEFFSDFSRYVLVYFIAFPLSGQNPTKLYYLCLYIVITIAFVRVSDHLYLIAILITTAFAHFMLRCFPQSAQMVGQTANNCRKDWVIVGWPATTDCPTLGLSWQHSCVLQQKINCEPTGNNSWPFSNIQSTSVDLTIDMCSATATSFLPKSLRSASGIFHVVQSG